MIKKQNMLILILVAVGAAASSLAQTTPAPKPQAPTPSVTAAATHAPVHAADLQWGDPPPGIPAGAKMAVLSGNPSVPGPFVVRAKMPAGYKIPAHSHPADEFITVLQGTVVMGAGDVLDAKQGTLMKVGSFVKVPKQSNHFLWTKTATIIQISGTGPFSITYVNPADDPRNAAKP